MPGEVPVLPKLFRDVVSGGTSLEVNVEVKIMKYKYFISRVFIQQSKYYTSARKTITYKSTEQIRMNNKTTHY